MRRLMLSPVFDELTKRSLMARIIKLYPDLQSLVSGGQTEEKSEALVVSWSSLQKRKAELEELVNKKIPENSKEIGVARSYGDLRENFEFKAAKEMQAVLMRRKSELERALHLARGTAFENPDTSQISIGTVVTLRETATDREETYTILGAWDGDPERSIISYQTAIGQALLGRRLGEIVELNAEEDTGRYAIIAIEPAPLDEVPADPELRARSPPICRRLPLGGAGFGLAEFCDRRSRRFAERSVCRQARSAPPFGLDLGRLSRENERLVKFKTPNDWSRGARRKATGLSFSAPA